MGYGEMLCGVYRFTVMVVGVGGWRLEVEFEFDLGFSGLAPNFVFP
jgi:hypothetical protein